MISAELAQPHEWHQFYGSFDGDAYRRCRRGRRSLSTAALQLPQSSRQLTIVRKPPPLVLREYELALRLDIEDALIAFDELRGYSHLPLDFSHRPGGLW